MMDDFGDLQERRNPTLEDIVKRAVELLKQEVAPLSHEEAEFVRAWIAETKRKQERWARIQEQVLGWSIIAMIGALGTGAVKLLQFWLKHGGPSNG